jgi:hypothetical protein
MQGAIPLLLFIPPWHAEGSLNLLLHTCLESSAETCRTNSICHGKCHCNCGRAAEQAELWQMSNTSMAPPPPPKVICTAGLQKKHNDITMQCAQTNKQKQNTSYAWHQFKARWLISYVMLTVLDYTILMFLLTSILIYCEFTASKTCMNIHHCQALSCKLKYLSLLGDSISFMKQIWNLSICVQRHRLYLELTHYSAFNKGLRTVDKATVSSTLCVQSCNLENAVFHLVTERVELKMPPLP